MAEKYTLQPEKPRSWGVSGVLRVKYSEDFLEAVIRSHVDLLDELVIVHAETNDQTLDIIRRCQDDHPDKIRLHAYPHPVAGIGSSRHAQLDDSHPESIASYYNWAFSKASFQVATKVDDDHLPVTHRFAEAVEKIKRTRPTRFIHTYSGLNVIKTQDGLLMPESQMVAGVGDTWFFDIAEDTHFEQHPSFERLTYGKRDFEHLGLLFWHLKFMKEDLGVRNCDVDDDEKPATKIQEKFKGEHLLKLEELQREANERFVMIGRSFKASSLLKGRPLWLCRVIEALLAPIFKWRERLSHINSVQFRSLNLNDPNLERIERMDSHSN